MSLRLCVCGDGRYGLQVRDEVERLAVHLRIARAEQLAGAFERQRRAGPVRHDTASTLHDGPERRKIEDLLAAVDGKVSASVGKKAIVEARPAIDARAGHGADGGGPAQPAGPHG